MLTYETTERDLVFSPNRKRIHFLSGFNLSVSNLVLRELSGFPAWVVEKSSLKLHHARIAFSRERVYLLSCNDYVGEVLWRIVVWLILS